MPEKTEQEKAYAVIEDMRGIDGIKAVVLCVTWEYCQALVNEWDLRMAELQDWRDRERNRDWRE